MNIFIARSNHKIIQQRLSARLRERGHRIVRQGRLAMLLNPSRSLRDLIQLTDVCIFLIDDDTLNEDKQFVSLVQEANRAETAIIAVFMRDGIRMPTRLVQSESKSVLFRIIYDDGQIFDDALLMAIAKIQLSKFSSKSPLEDAAPSRSEIRSAKKETYPVDFSAFYVSEMPVNQWATFLVYAHLENLFNEVEGDATAFAKEMGHHRRRTSSRQPSRIARNTVLRIVPCAEGLAFKPAEQTVSWVEDIERAIFRVQGYTWYRGEACNGEVRIYVGLIEIACVRFSVYLNDEVPQGNSKPDQPVADNPLAAAKHSVATTPAYAKIFISYSRKDKQVVESYRLAQLARGDDPFLDTENIRAGENWQAALANAIDTADVFQLFWSENSAQSSNVRDEWDYAIRYRCPDGRCAGFIRPVYWQKPMPEPPTELQNINFRYLPLEDNVDSG